MYFDSENILENKLIILFALSEFKLPMTKEQITQVILENVQISYFDIQSLIENLKRDEFIDELSETGVYYYTLSETGKSTLKLFGNRIPTFTRELISMFISQNKDKLLRQVKYESSYTKQNDEEFIVNLRLVENDVSLIDINLNVVNKNQATFVCSNWEENGEKLYHQIINALIDDSK